MRSAGSRASWTSRPLTHTTPNPVANTSASVVRDVQRLSRQCGSAPTMPTMAGRNVSSASALLNVRVTNTVQYDSPRKMVTAAASANDDSRGAAITAETMNAVNRGNVSKSRGESLKSQMPPAAITASRQLVTKSDRMSGIGHPVDCSTNKWIGSAASKRSGQRFGGARTSADARIALGGQRIDGVAPGSRRPSPTWHAA
jgi:hypothetical protein